MVAISATYVARETGSNLRRNLLMTVSAMITMAVSLSMLGGFLIMRQAIARATVQWKGGVQVAVFMQPQATQNEIAAVGHELASTPGVKSFHYVDKTQAYSEFKVIFGANSDIVDAVTPDELPTSYRVVPTNAGDVSELGNQFKGQPGVFQVTYAEQEIAAALHSFHQKRVVALGLAVAVMVGSVALIVTTIQLAIFARRREVAVMKLVGATNWFIRVPFMLEGLVDGVVGGLVASAIVYGFRNTIASLVGNENLLGFNELYATAHDAIMTGLVLVLVGAMVGVLGSAFAVRRFLAV
jgi:cell division transport system permease protein